MCGGGGGKGGWSRRGGRVEIRHCFQGERWERAFDAGLVDWLLTAGRQCISAEDVSGNESGRNNAKVVFRLADQQCP